MTLIEHYLANPIVSLTLGLLIGLFTSFFSWWVLFRYLSPAITLSPVISKTYDEAAPELAVDNSGVHYKIKLANTGRRAIVDLQVRAIVRIMGLADPNSSIWTVVHLPMVPDGELIYSFPKMNPLRQSKLRWILRLHLNSMDRCKRYPFPESIRKKAENRALLLEELLSLGKASQVLIIVSGYDEFSGARKVFEKVYLPNEIKLGSFQKNGFAINEVPSPSLNQTCPSSPGHAC